MEVFSSSRLFSRKMSKWPCNTRRFWGKKCLVVLEPATLRHRNFIKSLSIFHKIFLFLFCFFPCLDVDLSTSTRLRRASFRKIIIINRHKSGFSNINKRWISWIYPHRLQRYPIRHFFTPYKLWFSYLYSYSPNTELIVFEVQHICS